MVKEYRLRTRYYKGKEMVETLQDMKLAISNIIGLIFELRNEFRITRFLKRYKQFCVTGEKKVCRNAKEQMLGWLENTVTKMHINFRKTSRYDFVTTLLDLFLYDN